MRSSSAISRSVICFRHSAMLRGGGTVFALAPRQARLAQPVASPTVLEVFFVVGVGPCGGDPSRYWRMKRLRRSIHSKDI